MREPKLSILFLESFYGGSHRSFAYGPASHSEHRIEVRGLQAWNWKWRMHGSAVTFAEELVAPPEGRGDAGVLRAGTLPYDLMVVTSLLDVSDLALFNSISHRRRFFREAEAFLRRLPKPVPRRLAVAGQRYGRTPPIFEEARRRLAHRIVYFGFREDHREYRKLLATAGIVVSTAVQENFGISGRLPPGTPGTDCATSAGRSTPGATMSFSVDLSRQ